MNTSGIYELRNVLNGKRYIGASRHLLQRRGEHFRRLARGAHCNDHLQKAYNKYGKDAFEFRVLFSCVSKSIITRLEQAALDVIQPKYNILKFARGPVNQTHWLGRKHTEETKRKIGAAHKGRVFSEETKRRMGLAQLGNKKHLGHKHSEEARRKISQKSKINYKQRGRDALGRFT